MVTFEYTHRQEISLSGNDKTQQPVRENNLFAWLCAQVGNQ